MKDAGSCEMLRSGFENILEVGRSLCPTCLLYHNITTLQGLIRRDRTIESRLPHRYYVSTYTKAGGFTS
jgi:hypothetical protein